MVKFAFALQVMFVLVFQIYGSLPYSGRWKRQACSSMQFKCDSGECIDQFAICDGEKNCKDGSDETEKVCKNVRCPTFAFRCKYGACVDADAKCNGVVNCVDDSDEKGCPTKTQSSSCDGNRFQCKSGVCIDPFLLCDGPEDCDDGSDETSEACSGFTCPGFAFQCDYGACIDRDGLCNGVAQCADGSDEKPEKCGGGTSTTTTTAAPPASEGCLLPPQPNNGKYKLPGCEPPCQPQPGTGIRSTFITYTCDPGFTLAGDKYVACNNGWVSPFPSCSTVSCKPLVSPSREIVCKLNDKNVDCDKPMAPGTESNLKCSPFYSQIAGFSNYNIVCKADGNWSREVTPCRPNCGEQNPKGIPFIANGEKAQYGQFPWHVGIYVGPEGSIEQTCGGSIISERAVITAAHCFWDENTSKQVDLKNYRVALGKYYRDWNNRTQLVQIPEIQEVIIFAKYKGRNRAFANDIAIIILKNPINMTIAVRPICLDFDDRSIQLFTPGKSGIVVGWGITETMKPKDELYTATLPFVDFETCEKAVPEDFVLNLTDDKFCAGYHGNEKGTSVCPGDSGGGYAVKFKDGKWYLMGIVSIGVQSETGEECNIKQYATFTRVNKYYDFIKNYTANYAV